MQKELLSAYMDGEQVDVSFTEKLCNDEALQQSWASYHMVRAVIRKESDILLGTDFTEKIAGLIENENIEKLAISESQPTVEEVQRLPFMRKFKSFFAPMAQIAVAASVCLVAVIGVQSFNTKSDVSNVPETPVLQTLPFNNSVQEVSYNAPTKDVATTDQMEQKNRRIGAMLQNYELQRRMHADALNVGSNQSK
ncbi:MULTISPECIES: sigma-E factor negative regulatory protein [Rodentibacter]|uniref:sigma-E factor negative regulatory protein n=1 Tax=Rodentibacter TaxID=1960084 RepID=UPI001CFC8F00|nr:sigma-E factor negative regulatory protein [Rodentibacter sp. JRC1]GJI55838.1 anti-sigma-E factor RseA [Rodentibacter sp. JRC1]